MTRAAKRPRAPGAKPRKRSNQRARKTRRKPARGKSSGGKGGSRRRPAKRGPSNKRVDPTRRESKPRVELEPEERKARNRTYLLIAVLALVNLYMLVWRDRGSIAEFDLESAAIGAGARNFAAPENARVTRSSDQPVTKPASGPNASLA